MIIPIIIGIAFIACGAYYLKKYLRYKNGLVLKGVITKAEYKQVNIRRKMDVVEITYSYEVHRKNYSRTELSEQSKHLFKTHSLKGETIQIRVPKNAPEKATCKSLSNYLLFSLCVILLGLILITVGVIS